MRRSAHPRALLAVQCALIAAAMALAVITAHNSDWKLLDLLILVVLSGLSELTSSMLPSGIIVSGSFLGIMLAAVLLGGAPAAIVGAITITVGWINSRERGDLFRQNLVTYLWFPLLSGLVFRWLATTAGFHLTGDGFKDDPPYYLIVFATFVFALLLNMMMLALYQSAMDRKSPIRMLAVFAPMISAELASAVLTVFAVFIVNTLHLAGLLVFAIVLVVFQYLVGELLLSQQRGAELRKRATTDEITGLANRSYFNEQVDELIAAVAGSPGGFAVLLLDLDHFKDVNDTLGHQCGDDLLRDLGPRIAAQIGAGGLLARFGGDEFGILPAVRTNDRETLERIAQDVLACIREPIVIGEVTLQIDASIGIARYPEDGRDAQTLQRRADVAMYNAKAEHEGHRFYSQAQDRHSVSRLSMVGDFRRALESKDQIVLYFHPIVDLDGNGAVHGAEALIRWQHPDLGLLSPGAFLDIVEQTGLVGEMTERVLEMGIAQCAAWHRSGRAYTISINLSARNLHDPELAAQVAQLLERYKLPPYALKLEITESMILSDPQRALNTVETLSELGVRFAVDDFGTGHSSLANLRMLPVHEIKIDRSFVTPMLTQKSDAVIVRSTIDLGHALNLRVTAEGVEDAETLHELEALGCDRAQGHYLSKPLPAPEFIRWAEDYDTTALVA